MESYNVRKSRNKNTVCMGHVMNMLKQSKKYLSVYCSNQPRELKYGGTYMKKIYKKLLALALSGILTLSGIPVYGQDVFSSESTAEEFMGNSEPEVIFQDEERKLADSDEEDFFSENRDTFDAGEVTEEITEEAEPDYIKGRPLTEEEREEQLAPFKNLTTYWEAPVVGSDLGEELGSAYAANGYALYPSRYDSRKQGIITSAKNQNPFGICWSFALASLMETSLLLQGKGSYDLSEEHLAYFFANRVNDPLGNTPNDRNIHGSDYHQGGNDYLASIFLTTWSGMTTEADVPLPTDGSHTADYSQPLSAEKAYNTAAYLTDAVFSDYSQDRMKALIMEYGSVSFMYRLEAPYYNPDTGACCYPYKTSINHQSVAVGWDDNYSKDNFPERCNVQSDGAWIVKNSWGPDKGDNGYYYLSYEDQTICSLTAASATDVMKYDNNYFYDGSSGLSSIVLSAGQSAANIYDVKAGNGCDEVLGEVNVVTYSDNASYNIKVYANVSDKSDPTSGTLVYSSPYDIYQPFAGVNTVEIPEITLLQETSFSVVLTNTGSSSFKLNCESDANYVSGTTVWLSTKAGIETGQGFYKGATATKWTDLAKMTTSKPMTPRIKAHTRTLSAPVNPKLSFKASKTTLNIGESVKTTVAVTPSSVSYCGLTYVSSNPEIASVDSSGTIKAVNAGTAVITCKSSDSAGLSAKITVKVNSLPAPEFTVKASANGYNQITWKKVSGATGYRIYRKTPGGSWKAIASVASSVLKYNDQKITACAAYQYTVRAYRKVSGLTTAGKYTAGDVIKAAPALTKISSAGKESTGIRIKWNKQSQCDGYRIYRKTKTGSWQTIAVISKGNLSSYLDKTAQKGVSYYYAVKAFVKQPYGKTYSKYKSSSAVKR